MSERGIYGCHTLSEMLEHRKLMSLGASLVVTLPKPWLISNKLQKGGTVSMRVQRDQTLLISPGVDVQEEKDILNLPIDAEATGNSIVRSIVAGFLDGYSSILITSSNFLTFDQQRAIREISRSLYMMIVKSDASQITLETLLDESKMSIDTSIERLHFITYSMCRDIINSLKNPDKGRIVSVISLEDDVDNLTFLILRMIRLAAIRPALASKLGIDPIDCLDIQTLVHRIERIADHVTIMANSLIDLTDEGVEISQEVLSILLESAIIAFASYDQAVMSFLLRDVTNTDDVINMENEIEDFYLKITPLPYEGDLKDTSSISNIVLIRESIRKISHYAADIAELTINRTYNLS